MKNKKKEYFRNCEWFENTFGFKETLFNIDKFFFPRESDLGIQLYSDILERTFLAGRFSTRNISSFHLNSRGKGTFSIIGKLNDYLYAYSIPEFCGATFQVNTNFNCLNNVCIDHKPEDGVTSYIYLNTTGAQAAISTAASLVFRNYNLTLASDNKINLIRNTSMPVQEGFSLLSQIIFVKDDVNFNFDCSDLNVYEVGVQENCQVVLTRHDSENLRFLPYEQIVHQVFVSSFDLSDDQQNNRKLMISIEPFLLEAEYKSTILAAWENSLKYPNYPGSNKCFLTMIGYETCNVPLEIVFKSIQSCQDLIIESGLDVCLIANDKNCFAYACNNLGEMVNQTSGRIVS